MYEINDRILEFAMTYNLLNSKGEPFEWKDREYLVEPLCDWSRELAVIKATQLGFSESVGIIKALYAAKERKYNVIYTLPTAEFLEKFVPPKVDLIIKHNPEAFHDVTGNIGKKKVGDGLGTRYIYFMGTFTGKSESEKELSDKGISVTADMLIHDEASRSDQYILSQLRSRLDNSDYKGRLFFDNPSYPLMGADAVYTDSKQKHWIITCGHCGYKQYVDWIRLDKEDFESGAIHTWVNPEKKIFECGKCRKEITDYDRRTGEWVAKYPDRTKSGYWMPQMISIKHNVETLLEKEEDRQTGKSYFYNFVLAKPYIGSDVRVSREDLIACVDNTTYSKDFVAMGVDQGENKHYVLMNDYGIFKKGVTKDWDEIEFLKRKYDAKMVVDALPYQRQPKKLAEKYPNSVWRAFYKPETDQREIFKFGTKADNSIVLIRREEAFDLIVDDIQVQDFRILIPVADLGEYVNHWESLVRIVEPDKYGNERFIWHSVTGEDHYAHATLYAYAAMQRVKRGKSSVISKKKKSKYKETFVSDTGARVDIMKDFTRRIN